VTGREADMSGEIARSDAGRASAKSQWRTAAAAATAG